ncbi:MAG: C4-type zinc ribbon domain-containing protein [Verrucomicrobiae bacterium]|nr:C4-type zinc ribbon domain-containing protein [Verrucomicrobiae bacterium]
MLEVIEKLLRLQERDREISHTEAELADISPHRQLAMQALDSAKSALDSARSHLKKLEAERNHLELEVKTRKELIEKYSFQQFQTKKNAEYQALAHEIENCKKEITSLEDKELEVLEEIDVTQARIAQAAEILEQTRQRVEQQMTTLAQREATLRERLATLIKGRSELAAAVDGGLLPKYERLKKSKGDRVVVSIERSACGGCHVRLPAQVVLGCQVGQEVMTCPNCGRILYYTPGMDLVPKE